MIYENINLLQNKQKLTEIELDIFNKSYNASKKIGPSVIIRAAGGWVRDKLLGKESDDIDMCVEGCNAYEFAEKLKDEFESEVKIKKFSADVQHGKNTETYRLLIDSRYWIDICSLRGKDNEVGTVLSDAQYRDFTINALFYNINESKVEDFVGGIDDLINKVIKTPIDPTITLTDDPLRIIRAARFRSVYKLTIDNSIMIAAKDFRDKFVEKIKRERIVKEMEKIIASYGFLEFLIFLKDINFFDIIFNPGNIYSLDVDEAIERVGLLYKNISDDSLICELSFASLYEPLLNAQKQRDPEHHSKLMSAIEYLVIRILRMRSSVGKDAKKLVEGATSILKLRLTRLDVGKWILNLKGLWPYTKFLMKNKEQETICNNVFSYIEKENLGNVYNMERILKGHELCGIHNVKEKNVRKYIENLTYMQIENPNLTREMYIDLAKSNKICL